MGQFVNKRFAKSRMTDSVILIRRSHRITLPIYADRGGQIEGKLNFERANLQIGLVCKLVPSNGPLRRCFPAQAHN
jgi:hypothetical protein